MSFASNSSANVELIKTQLSKIGQSWGFLGWLLVALLKTGLLWLTAAVSSTDTAIEKEIFVSGMTAIMISNEEMDDTVKTIKFPEESGLSIKGVSETIQNEAKEQKSVNALAGKGAIWTTAGKWTIRAGEGTIGAGQDFQCLLIWDFIVLCLAYIIITADMLWQNYR